METGKGEMLAEIWDLHGAFCFRIPKRRGCGFLKSCVGWNGLNKYGKKLRDILESKEYIDASGGDFCDIDGYLSIFIKPSFMCYLEKKQIVEEDLKAIIIEVFPFIEGFKPPALG